MEKKDFSLDVEQPLCPASSCPMASAVLPALLEALKPKPFRARHPALFWTGVTLLSAILLTAVLQRMETAGLAGGDRLAVVRVEGMISDIGPLLRWIDKLRRDESVKGVLLRIDSPGGGAAASQELYEALRLLGIAKPLAASMGSVAASGGLMAAMAAQHVTANPSTVTGSIGVRMDLPQVQGLMDKLGLGKETLVTGRFKDAGSFTRPMTAEERVYLLGVIQDMHEQFILLVAEGRKMPVDKARALADGRVMTGREAREKGLVDELGGQEAAVAYLRRLTGVGEGPLLERPKSGGLWKEALESVLGGELDIRRSAPAFLYAY